MTTDTSVLLRHAQAGPNDSITAPLETTPTATDRPIARPHLPKRGAWGLLRSLVSDDSRLPASDHLLLLGPNGGPVWTSRIQ